MEDEPEQDLERATWRAGDFLNPREAIPASLYVALGVGSFAFLLALWAALTYTGLIDPLFLPTPGRVLQAGLDLFFEFGFTTDIANSTYRVMLGFVLASILGVPLGLLMGTFKAAEALIEPIMGFIRYMPASAFIPLFILWLGIGDVEKVAIIFVGAFSSWYLMVAVVAKNVHKDMLETAYTLGAKRVQMVLEGPATCQPPRHPGHAPDHRGLGVDVHRRGGAGRLLFRDRIHDHQRAAHVAHG